MGCKTNPIDLVTDFRCAKFRQSWQPIAEIHKGIRTAGLDITRPVGNERHIGADVEQGAFSAGDPLAIADGINGFVFILAALDVAQLGALGGAVVTSEKNDGLFPQAKLVNLRDELSDHRVHALDHLAVIHPAILAGHVRHLHRDVIRHVMRQRHGVVRKKRFSRLGALGHELAQKIHVQIRAVLALGVRAQPAVFVNERLMKPRPLVPAKHTPFIEAHARGLLQVVFHQA